MGPPFVRYALRRGHHVTLFHRGRTNADLFPGVETLRGNRDPNIDEGLSALRGRKWDAVIDTSSYLPRLARASAELLAENVEHWLFISSVSAYADFTELGMTERAALATMDDEAIEEITGDTYGALKVRCEEAVRAAMPGRVTVVRPGLIVGPGDPTDRFTYWPVRVQRGGEVLAPAEPDHRVQHIDVRDLMEWCLHLVEQRIVGTFNAVGPREPETIGEVLATCKRVTRSDASFTWAETAWLADHGVHAWSEMPVWVPADSEMRGMVAIDNTRAVAAGLGFRPLARTVEDTLAWIHGLEDAAHRLGHLKAGLTPEREAKVLAAWRARRK